MEYIALRQDGAIIKQEYRDFFAINAEKQNVLERERYVEAGLAPVDYNFEKAEKLHAINNNSDSAKKILEKYEHDYLDMKYDGYTQILLPNVKYKIRDETKITVVYNTLDCTVTWEIDDKPIGHVVYLTKRVAWAFFMQFDNDQCKHENQSITEEQKYQNRLCNDLLYTYLCVFFLCVYFI